MKFNISIIKKIKTYLRKRRGKRKKQKVLRVIKRGFKKIFTKRNFVKFVVGIVSIALVASYVLPYIVR